MPSGLVRGLEPAPNSSQARTSGVRSTLERFATTVAVAAVLLGVAVSSGGYGLTIRTALAVGVWLVVMVGVAFGFLPRRPLTRGSRVVPALLGLFGLWTFASVFWAANPEGAFTEFDRVSLYVGLLLLACLSATERSTGHWADGLCLGVVATAAIALASRFFPHLFSPTSVSVGLPYGESRLSFPVGYWNGLGIFVSLGVPLCLRTALVARARAVRGLALGAVPLLAGVVYLTSSRGAIVTAFVGVGCFLFATAQRWRALGAAVAGGIGGALAVAFLAERHTLVNGPLRSSLAEAQGRTALALVLGCCLLAGALYLVGDVLLAGRAAPRPLVGRVLVAAVALVAVAVVAASHPVARFDAFKRPIPAVRPGSGDFATNHLLSGNGSGRWQFWAAAFHEFESAPLQGRGAGSYGAWWAQHATFTYFLRNAHSLYFEVLGELGVVGLSLLVGAFAVGLGVVVKLLRGSALDGERRVTVAALTAVVVAFLAGAGIDWIWQFAAIGGVGIVALGLVAVASSDDARAAPQTSSGIGPAVIVVVTAWVLICGQAIPWLAAGKISDSQAAIRRGDSSAALKNALDAKSLEPWAASPYVQLALVSEQQHDFATARRFISSAIRRDSSDWSVWYLAARIERESGATAAAARSSAKARSLNPRSPLFAAAP